MSRVSFKPDSSFFRKIALGAVGARTVAENLSQYGHKIVELERGSTDTKLWKEVKRKRVRIPDLLCMGCGRRFESRAKTKADLSMSHSPSDETRAWDFGMVDSDTIAFPVCKAVSEKHWSLGRLESGSSYWHERNWVRWKPIGATNYFSVQGFRSAGHSKSTTKGVTEGSETSISWAGVFSTRTGTVEAVNDRKVTIRRESDGHRYTWKIPSTLPVLVSAGQRIEANHLIASSVRPQSPDELACPGNLPGGRIADLVSSRERTQRFTGVRLARVRLERDYLEPVSDLVEDEEEDVYTRLEGVAYLVGVHGQSVRTLFEPHLESMDQQIRLEAVIALGEAGTPEAMDVLGEILDDTSLPYFMRSAAAWSLGKSRNVTAAGRLVRAFSDIDVDIREEALQGIITTGKSAFPALLRGLRESNQNIAAGSAEALRQLQPLSHEVIAAVVKELSGSDTAPWAVWLLGHLPREHVASLITPLQSSAPHLHYAMTLLWSFVESWIAPSWELCPAPSLPRAGEI